MGKFLGNKISLTGWLWLLLLSIAVGQEYQLIQSIPTDAHYFSTDKLQNVYLVRPTNEIIKYDPDGRQLFHYNNNRLGELTYMDSNNPFKIMLFYPDLANLIYLDRTMNETGDMRLFDFNFVQVEAVAMASDNNIWLYDNLDFHLKKIDRTGKTVVESIDLSLLLNEGLRPNFLVEREQKVYVNDPEVGILVFDIFGQYIKTLDFKGLKRFQIVDGQLYFYKNSELKVFNLTSLLLRPVKLPPNISETAYLQIQKNRLFILDNGQLDIYRF